MHGHVGHRFFHQFRNSHTNSSKWKIAKHDGIRFNFTQCEGAHFGRKLAKMLFFFIVAPIENYVDPMNYAIEKMLPGIYLSLSDVLIAHIQSNGEMLTAPGHPETTITNVVPVSYWIFVCFGSCSRSSMFQNLTPTPPHPPTNTQHTQTQTRKHTKKCLWTLILNDPFAPCTRIFVDQWCFRGMWYAFYLIELCDWGEGADVTLGRVIFQIKNPEAKHKFLAKNRSEWKWTIKMFFSPPHLGGIHEPWILAAILLMLHFDFLCRSLTTSASFAFCVGTHARC